MAAFRKVEDLSTNPEFIGYYDVEEKYKQDIEDAKEYGKEQGIEQGIKQRNIEIAKNMILLDISYENISKVTGLSIEEIKKIDI